MRVRRIILLGLPLLTLSLMQVRGEEPKPTPRDPFATPAAMKRATPSPKTPTRARAQRVPRLQVKGILQLRGRAPGALLAVGGETFVVRPGQRLEGTFGKTDSRWELEVLSIGRSGVRVRIDGRIRTVR